EGLPDYGPLLESCKKSEVKYAENVLFLEGFGSILYRAGQFQAAIDQLEKANKIMPRNNPTIRFFLAMAHHQLAHSGKARQWLYRAVKEMEADAGLDQRFRRGLGWGSVRPLTGGLGGLNDVQTENEWIGRCMVQLLSREAETLIKGPPPPEKPNK